MIDPKKDRFYRGVEIVSRVLATISGAAGGFTIFAMTMLITVDVLGRYLFGRPTMVAVEISGYMLVAMIFLGLAYTEKRDRHITITVITDRIPVKRRRAITIVNIFAAAILAAWLTWFTLQPVIQDFELGTVSLTGTRTPIWVPGLLIPVGFGLLSIQLLTRLLKTLRSSAANGE